MVSKMKTFVPLVLITILVLSLSVLPLICGAAIWSDPTTTLVSAGVTGHGGDRQSARPAISNDGKRIAYWSGATDLVEGITTNGYVQVYLYDVDSGLTTLITKGASGQGGNGTSDNPEISGNGQRIVFESNATDLIDGFPTVGKNVFLYDIPTDTFSLVTTGQSGNGVSDGGEWGATISNDGTKIAYNYDGNDALPGKTLTGNNVFYYDANTQYTRLVTPGAGGDGMNNYRTMMPGISPDGTKIAFQSQGTDLIDGITLDEGQNVFLYDVASEEMTLVTKGPDGLGTGQLCSTGNPTEVSSDNTMVIFSSQADNLINGFPTNGSYNIYIYYIATEEIVLVTTGSAGDGGDYDSFSPTISNNCKVIGFMSFATDLVPGQTPDASGNAFIYEIASKTTTLVSTPPDGDGGNGQSNRPRLSCDASSITFHSNATNLIPDFEPNGIRQVYLVHYDVTYEVTFDGQNNTDPLVVPVPSGSTVAQPTDPTKAGYIFDGWWTAPDGGVPFDFGTLICGDITLYAHWIPVSTPEPEPPVIPDEPGIPPTGDVTSWMGSAVMLVVALSALSAGVCFRKD